MQRSNAYNIEIEELLNVSLSCLEQGLDSKETVKEDILNCIKSKYFACGEIKELEDIPTKVLEFLNRRLGIEFNLSNGKLIDANINKEALVYG
ncbi:MAG: hypothetical protein RR654_00665 [Oscillospiraceae bacterium]